MAKANPGRSDLVQTADLTQQFAEAFPERAPKYVGLDLSGMREPTAEDLIVGTIEDDRGRCRRPGSEELAAS